MRKKSFALIGCVVLLAMAAAAAWWWRGGVIISGYPPPEEIPDWLPSPLVPHPDPAVRAWLYTAVDADTQYRQLFLYTGALHEFRGARGVRLTASASEKTRPAWGPVLEGVGGCTGRSLFFLADPLEQGAPARALRMLCLASETLPEAPPAAAEIPVAVRERTTARDLADFLIDTGNVLHLMAVESEGGFVTGLVEEGRILLQPVEGSRSFADYRSLQWFNDHRAVLFSGLHPRTQTWQIGLLEVASGREWPVTAFDDFDFDYPTTVPGDDTLIVVAAKARDAASRSPLHVGLLRVMLPRTVDVEPGGCERIDLLPLPEGMIDAGGPPVVRGARAAEGLVVEAVLEISGADAPHQLYYGKVAPAECPLGDRSPQSVHVAEWGHAAAINCAADNRHPQWVQGVDGVSSLYFLGHAAASEGVTPVIIPDIKLPGQPEAGGDICPGAVDGATSSDATPAAPPPSTGPCQSDADCGQFEINKCEGKKYCDKSSGDPATYQCKLNSKLAVVCPIGQNTACVTNTCDPKTGTCAMVAAPDGQACNADQQSCTKADVCHGGKCVAGGWDYTDPQCQCAKEGDCLPHEDGNFCNGTLYCDLATHTCLLNPSTAVYCPSVDDAECMKNLCQPATGKCAMTPVKGGETCDDFNSCTQGETCQSGKCTGGTNTCQCTSTAACAPYEDGNLCNGILYCDIAKGKCVLNPVTIVECFTTNDTATMQNTCNPKTGKCEMTPTSP